MEPVNLNTQGQVQPDTINLAGTPMSIVPDIDVAQTRATKASHGLQNVNGKSQEDWFKGFMQGQENDLRNESATEANFMKLQEKQQYVQSVASRYPDAASLAADKVTMAKITGVPAPTDPETVIEQYFAGEYLKPMWNISDQFNRGTFLPQAIKDDPQGVQKEIDSHQDILSRQQYFQTGYEKAMQAQSNQGVTGKALELGRDYFPLFPNQIYQEAKLRGWSGSMYLDKPLGDALKATGEDFYRLPWDQAKAKFDQAMVSLPPELAIKFASYMVGMPADAIEQENAAEVLNLAGDITMVGSLMRIALKTPVKAVMNLNKGTVTPADVNAVAAGAQGNLAEAAAQKVAGNSMAKMTGNPNPVKEAVEALPDSFRQDTEYYRTNPGRSGQEIANRVAEDTAASATNFQDAVQGAMKINRTPAFTANQDVAKLAVNQLSGRFKGINSSVLNQMDPVVTYYGDSNRYTVGIPLGDADAELFRNKKQAESFVRTQLNKLSTATIEKSGNGYYVNVTANLDEGMNMMWDTAHDIPGAFSGPASKGERKGTQVPYLMDPVTGLLSDRIGNVVKAFSNSFGGKFDWRSPEETLSPEENQARKIATFGPHKLMEMFQDNNKIIMEGNTKDLKRVQVFNQSMPDPVDPTIKGAYFKGIPELEQHFQQSIGRQPTDKEIRAYFAVKNNYEMERSLMSMMEIRNKSRNGIQQWQISRLGEGTAKSNPVISSDWFDARSIDSLPRDGEPMLVNLDGRHHVVATDRWNETSRASADEKIKNGEARILELWNRNTKPLHSYSENINPESEPRYVLTDRSNTKQLDINSQVTRRGGGHLIPEYGYYIKKADTYLEPTNDKWIYRGDITVSAARNEAEAKEAAAHLNVIHEHMVAGDEAGARKYMQDTGIMGMDFDKDILRRYQAKFKPLSGPEPYQVVPVNKTIPDIDNSLEQRLRTLDGKSGMVDGTKHGNLSRTATVAFNEQRDAYELHTLENHGTPSNPLWSYQPAKLLDPMDSLNRSMSRLANSYYMDDYRNYAAQHWLQTFTPWLKLSQDDIRRAPLYAFYKAEWRDAAPAQVKLLGESNRKKAIDFLGTPNAFQAMTNTVGDSLMNSIYRNQGGKYLPFTELARTKDPLQVIRGLTFDLKLGLGALPTFWTQFTAHSNIFAIAPKQSASAAMGTLFHQWARVNPEIIDELDRRASSGQHIRGMLGMQTWKPGQFKEAWETLHQTSFSEVGSEHAMLDSMLQDRGISTAMDGLRYWGRTAFREGAQSVRNTAWYSAYLEHREANPVGSLSRTDKQSILDRASMLDHDMNRASNSAMNSGIMSVPAQFYTYARNLSEMFYGKRLTTAEKARLFGVNAALWGLPAGGIGLLGMPLGDWFRKQAESGNLPGGAYTPGENVGSTAVYDGLLTVLGAHITGKGNFQAGQTYDFSKFGVKGWDPLNNFLDSDKGMWDFIGGASYSTISNTAYRSHNFLADMADLLHGGDKFKFTTQDVADLFKESSGFSGAWKLYMGLAHHIRMSNNNTPLGNESTSDALLSYFTGLIPTEVADIDTHRQILQDRTSYTNYVTSQASRNFNLALISKRDGDEDAYIQYMKKGNAWMASTMFPPDKRMSELHSIFSRKDNLIDSINWQLTNQNVPENKTQIELDRAKTIQNLKTQRAQ
jgi:hypothetical protein